MTRPMIAFYALFIFAVMVVRRRTGVGSLCLADPGNN